MFNISLVLSSPEHRHSGDVGDATNAAYAPGPDDQPVPGRLQDASAVPEELATHIDGGETLQQTRMRIMLAPKTLGHAVNSLL